MARINTNVSALNTQRSLRETDRSFAQVVGRLSSGLRINRAADDAAGLGIANSLAGRIRGLTSASRNAEQADSLLQVAEGGLQQVEGILERLKELSVQSASDNVNNTDRALIDQEFQQLKSEITRIVDTTKFQGNTLLNGSLGASVTGGTALAGSGVQSVTISGTSAGTFTFANAAADLGTVTLSDGGGVSQQKTFVAGKQTVTFDKFGITVETDAAFTIGDGGTTAGGLDTKTVIVGAGTGADFVVGDSGSVSNDTVSLSNLDVDLTSLGINLSAADTKANAQAAVAAVDAAISTASTEFGKIGAAQNRLDFARANVESTLENFAAAESVIRDADVAAEATELSRLQILQQAATAVLAQANTAPQGVLALLR